MKRIISMILTAAVLMSLMAGLSMTAFADTYVDEVELTMDAVTAGAALPTTATTGEYGTVAGISWEKWNFTTSTWEAVSGNAEAGNAYRMTVRINANAGYVFNIACFYCVNGVVDEYAYGDGTYVDVIHAFPVGLTEIDQVTFATEPTVTEGADSTQALSGLTVAADAPYVITDAQWHEMDIQNSVTRSFSGTFQKGKVYMLDAFLAPKAGFWFDEDFEASAANLDNYNKSEDEALVWVNMLYYLTTPIAQVDITVSGMEQGKNAEDVKVTVPENCVLDDAGVYDDDWNEVTGVFGNNKYIADIYLAPADGYHFTEDVEVTVNGQKPDYIYRVAGNINVEKHCDFREQIKQVELPAWPEVKAGEPIPQIMPANPEGKQYGYMLSWTDYTDGTVPQGTFADNRSYLATCIVSADAGYRFADGVQITIDGVAYTGVVRNMGEVLVLVRAYSLGTAKLIDRLDVTVEMPAIGAKPGKISVAENANYDLMIDEWVVSTTGEIDDADNVEETFKLGDHVYLILAFTAESGNLDPNAKVFINGKEYALVPEITNISGRSFIAVVYLGQLLNEVDTVKLSGAHPSAGRTPGEAKDAGSEHCKLESAVWGVSKEQGKDIQPLSGTYAAGDHAYLTVTYAFDDTYTAAEDLKILFNGKEYPLVEGMTSVADGKLTATIYIGQMKAATNPGTGDTTPVVILTVLAVASVLGMGVLIGRRRAF